MGGREGGKLKRGREEGGRGGKKGVRGGGGGGGGKRGVNGGARGGDVCEGGGGGGGGGIIRTLGLVQLTVVGGILCQAVQILNNYRCDIEDIPNIQTKTKRSHFEKKYSYYHGSS